MPTDPLYDATWRDETEGIVLARTIAGNMLYARPTEGGGFVLSEGQNVRRPFPPDVSQVCGHRTGLAALLAAYLKHESLRGLEARAVNPGIRTDVVKLAPECFGA